MMKVMMLMTLLFIAGFGISFAFQAVDRTTQTMMFTGGPGFPPVDKTTTIMQFTGQ